MESVVKDKVFMRSLKIISILLFSILEFQTAFSQSNNVEHPLDEEYQKCLQEDLGNYGERRCHSEFEEKWDKELNVNYNYLIELLEIHMDPIHGDQTVDSITLTNLRTAQRQWLKYRDEEFKLINKLYDRKGSMYYTIKTFRRMSIVRQRALELMRYCNSFQ